MPPPLDFPLSFVKPLLVGFSVPAAAFNPQKSWKARYRTYCLVGNVKVPNGNIAMERSVEGEGSVLHVRCERSAPPGCVHILSGEVCCAADTLARPRAWRVTGDAVGVRGARLGTIAEGNAEKIEGRLSHQWSLLDAVQRLPRGTFPTLRFQFLTCDGVLLPDHTLAYRGAIEIAAGRLHGYEHLGTGILPWIYYTSDSGRLLIAVSGLEAWLFDEEKL